MKALDYAIRTENWELAALCLVLGAVEAVKELPPDTVDEMLGLLDWDEDEPQGKAGGAPGAEQAGAPTGDEGWRPRPCGPSGRRRWWRGGHRGG